MQIGGRGDGRFSSDQVAAFATYKTKFPSFYYSHHLNSALQNVARASLSLSVKVDLQVKTPGKLRVTFPSCLQTQKVILDLQMFGKQP